MVIAIDFDGTIVEDAYPAIGEPKIFAFETIKEIQKAHHQIILWTHRQGEELAEAVEFCKKNGVDFYAVNNSFPEEVFEPNSASRKLNCEMFISHKNIGGIEGWGEMWQEIKSINGKSTLYDQQPLTGGVINKLLGIFKR